MNKLRILMIGGTGTISSAITRQLAASGHELWLLNRGTRSHEVPAGVTQVKWCDNIIDAQEQAKSHLIELINSGRLS